MGFRSNAISVRLVKKNNWISNNYSKFDYKIESIKHRQAYAYLDEIFKRVNFKKAVLLFSHIKLLKIQNKYLVTLFFFDRWGQIFLRRYLKRLALKKVLNPRRVKNFLMSKILANTRYNTHKKNFILFYRLYYKVLLPYIKQFSFLHQNSLNLHHRSFHTSDLVVTKIIYLVYNKYNLLNMIANIRNILMGISARGIRKQKAFILSFKSYLKITLKLISLLEILLKYNKFKLHRNYFINKTFNKNRRIRLLLENKIYLRSLQNEKKNNLIKKFKRKKKKVIRITFNIGEIKYNYIPYFFYSKRTLDKDYYKRLFQRYIKNRRYAKKIRSIVLIKRLRIRGFNSKCIRRTYKNIFKRRKTFKKPKKYLIRFYQKRIRRLRGGHKPLFYRTFWRNTMYKYYGFPKSLKKVLLLLKMGARRRRERRKYRLLQKTYPQYVLSKFKEFANSEKHYIITHPLNIAKFFAEDKIMMDKFSRPPKSEILTRSQIRRKLRKKKKIS